MKKLTTLLASTALVLLLARCATLPYQPQAREVKKRPTAGGTIALGTTYRLEDRAHADVMMKSNCGNQDVRVMEEGEVVVGERADATTDKNARTTTNAFTIGGLTFGNDRPAEKTTTHTVQLKEWHITYDCVASAAKKIPPVVAKKKIR